jgi:hypothetical protein
MVCEIKLKFKGVNMAKESKEDLARREGMAYALKVAKEKGIEGLEEEIKFRGITKIPVGVPRSACDEAINKIKLNTIDTITILFAATLRDEFDFGTKRIQRALNRFNDKAEHIIGDYCTWDDYIQVIQEELGITLAIRKNE